jgi:hypothetical protein
LRDPTGIVFHETESPQAPLQPSETVRLVHIGRSLLDFVRQNQSYHYVIDRFGRVWRIVPESNIAAHAGWSIWADADRVYLNLNSGFLGVALESAGGAPVPDSQIRSLRVLIEWLRYRYAIPASNCVAHAQVSVNPHNMRIGYHSDWARGFPFAAAGLPDNYRTPIPAISLFGFRHDAALIEASGGRPWPGIAAAEEELRGRAAFNSRDERLFLRRLQDHYRALSHEFRTLAAHAFPTRDTNAFPPRDTNELPGRDQPTRVHEPRPTQIHEPRP